MIHEPIHHIKNPLSHATDHSPLEQTIHYWQSYLSCISNWQSLIQGIDPKECGCGLVYELPHPLSRANESFAIADMRTLKFSEPHYHLDTEIYIILQGKGMIVVGEKEYNVEKGSIIITPPLIAHFTIPKKDLVLAVINIPAFKIENYIPLTEENLAVKFNKAQFDILIKK